MYVNFWPIECLKGGERICPRRLIDAKLIDSMLSSWQYQKQDSPENQLVSLVFAISTMVSIHLELPSHQLYRANDGAVGNTGP